MIIFKNITDRTFIGRWNKVPYEIGAGKEIALEDYLARHFAKHLIDGILTRASKMTNDKGEREKLEKLCLITEAPKKEEESVVVTAATDEAVPVKPEPRKKSKKKVEVEVEFPDLNQ